MRQWSDLIGQTFGRLTVAEQAPSDERGQRRWLCRCECGGTRLVTTAYLTGGRVTDCGCGKSPDLTGKRFGRLTVLGRSDRRGSRGARTTPLWECRCDCGEITYKAADTLTNPDVSMCKTCAAAFAVTRAREGAGYTEGTQLSRIQNIEEKSDNRSGVRGVYLDGKTGRYRARIRFRGKLYNLGSYPTLEEAVKARRRGEEDYFGKFLETREAEETGPL